MSKPNSDLDFSASSPTSRGLRGPVLHLALFALAGLVLVFGVSLGLTRTSAPSLALGIGGYGFGVALAFILLQRGFPYQTLGFCNAVTLTRLALAAALLAPLAHPTVVPWALFAVAATALSLDGVDGWLARREGRVSDFGARFDMEVDSALALILALNAWAAGTMGPLVLLIGLPRYVFVAAALGLPWLKQALPDRFGRKAVCVAQIAALIGLQLPGLPSDLGLALVVTVAAALLWSFGRDVAWLWRHRA
ncbi:MAG: CDP-alcohol phosphatidyltransferase family protein [Gemmobacter sp.]|nr:CDP-alcohol phosphatidyltransferase family protein [Gemmobacter sp.]